MYPSHLSLNHHFFEIIRSRQVIQMEACWSGIKVYNDDKRIRSVNGPNLNECDRYVDLHLSNGKQRIRLLKTLVLAKMILP